MSGMWVNLPPDTYLLRKMRQARQPGGLERAKDEATEKKRAQRARKRFQAGGVVKGIMLDGVMHPCGCECYDCLYGEGAEKWVAYLREPMTQEQVYQAQLKSEGALDSPRGRMTWTSGHQRRPVGGVYR